MDPWRVQDTWSLPGEIQARQTCQQALPQRPLRRRYLQRHGRNHWQPPHLQIRPTPQQETDLFWQRGGRWEIQGHNPLERELQRGPRDAEINGKLVRRMATCHNTARPVSPRAQNYDWPVEKTEQERLEDPRWNHVPDKTQNGSGDLFNVHEVEVHGARHEPPW